MTDEERRAVDSAQRQLKQALEGIESLRKSDNKDIDFKIWHGRTSNFVRWYFGDTWQSRLFANISYESRVYDNYSRQYKWSQTAFTSGLDKAAAVLEEISKTLPVMAIRRLHSQKKEAVVSKPKRVFISHGRNEAWRELQQYLIVDRKIEALELSQQPNRGKTVINKLDSVASQCSFAVIVMTGDNLDIDGKPYARENVMHEIGFFQGRYGLDRVCILYETGTNIPSNLSGVVYVEFPKSMVKMAFPELLREIEAAFEEN